MTVTGSLTLDRNMNTSASIYQHENIQRFQIPDFFSPKKLVQWALHWHIDEDIFMVASFILFFWIRGNLTFLKSVLYRLRWGSKTPVVPGSYKRCTPWLELDTCCADLKPFAITLHPLGTRFFYAKP
jgi:hypothetical protein